MGLPLARGVYVTILNALYFRSPAGYGVANESFESVTFIFVSNDEPLNVSCDSLCIAIGTASAVL